VGSNALCRKGLASQHFFMRHFVREGGEGARIRAAVEFRGSEFAAAMNTPPE